MTFKEFKQWADLHSSFIKDEDRDKINNLFKMAHTAGFNNCKQEVIKLLNTKYGNNSGKSSSKPSRNGSVRSRFSERIHDWLGR